MAEVTSSPHCLAMSCLGVEMVNQLLRKDFMHEDYTDYGKLDSTQNPTQVQSDPDANWRYQAFVDTTSNV